jgi:hypothetical protein
MGDAFQIAGAIAILIAFGLAQVGKLDLRSYPYLILNVVGGGILGIDAWRKELWGFLILEIVWTAVSLWGLVQRARQPKPADV